MEIYIGLYNVSIKLRQSFLGKKVYDIFENVGLRIAISRFFNRIYAMRDYKEPTERMNNSKIFFDKNIERIDEVRELLADEVSKTTLSSMIAFRCDSDYKKLPPNSMRTQYFVNNFFCYQKNEVYIDCGAYDGDSIINFKRIMKKNRISEYRIIAFEPNEKNYINLKRNHKDVTAYKCGVWSENGYLQLNSDANNRSKLVKSEQTIIDKGNTDTDVYVKAIDDEDCCKNASFIKMDIEGAEWNAILGARKVITRNRPKLAICIYHSDEDMLRLIELIHNMVPEYKLYVRQHSNSIYETVLYATV